MADKTRNEITSRYIDQITEFLNRLDDSDYGFLHQILTMVKLHEDNKNK